MSTKHAQRASSATGLILILLALIALLGLLTGLLAHTLVTRGRSTAHGNPSANGPHVTATSTLTSTPVPVTGVEGTVTPASSVTTHFQLSVNISPKAMSPGQQFTVTIHAFTPDTHAPVEGLQCVLRAPTDGSQGLLTTWPAAQTTDATGTASWTITAPNVPAGTYTIEAYASISEPKWSYRLDATAQVRAG